MLDSVWGCVFGWYNTFQEVGLAFNIIKSVVFSPLYFKDAKKKFKEIVLQLYTWKNFFMGLMFNFME